MRVRGLLLAAMVLLGACNSSGGDSADTTTTTTEAAAPTTVETTTTTSASTEMELLEDQLITFHLEYNRDLDDVDTTQPGNWDRILGWYQGNAVEPLRSVATSNYQTARDGEYEFNGPGNIVEIVDIEWNGATTPREVSTKGVSVRSCMIDLLEKRAPDGTIETPRSRIFTFTTSEYYYDLQKNRFYASNYQVNEECDPAQLLLDEDRLITSESDLEVVLAVHNEFLTVALGGIDQRVEGYESSREAGRRLTVDAGLEQIAAVADYFQEQGWYADGKGYESHIAGVRVDGDYAAIVDCSRSAVTIYADDGAIAEPADDFYELRESFFVKREGQWFINYFWQQGDKECNPS